MKNSETDRELNDLIKGALDNWEEQYILGSWENFVRIRKRRKKFILWISCTSVAASLLIGWLGFRFILPGTFSSGADGQQQNISNLEVPAAKDTLKERELIRQLPSMPAQNKKTRERGPDLALQITIEPQNQKQKEVPDSFNILGTEEDSTSASNSDNNQAEKNPANHLSDTSNTGVSSHGNTIEPVSSLSMAPGSDTSGNKPVYKQGDVNITPENNPSENNRSQKFRFGVNVSPGVTSTSTASSFNFSGGVNADYELSRSFRFSTGVQVEHQNVINESSDNPDWIPSGQTQADLVDIDLPLNLTWKFMIRKSGCYYLSGGISSVIYLSENYTSTSYTQKMVGTVEMSDGVPNVAYQLENVKSVEQETEAPLSTFDFAGRINIIFGFEQHLSATLFLHLEPFIKIPVSDLATQNLKFTTSGITCKISF
jgi:hypothetical protein